MSSYESTRGTRCAVQTQQDEIKLNVIISKNNFENRVSKRRR